jgi:ABC-type glycerol-3-phosphate transport system substrate-binding protein
VVVVERRVVVVVVAAMVVGLTSVACSGDDDGAAVVATADETLTAAGDRTTVVEDAGDASGAEHDGDVVPVVVDVSDGSVSTADDRVGVALGGTVEITVTADVADEVHVHGYDLHGDVAPGSPAVVRFTADVPGVFEVELEDAGLLLVELEVS